MTPVRTAVAVCATITFVLPVTAAGAVAATDPHHEAVRRAAAELVAKGAISGSFRVTRNGRTFQVIEGTTRHGGRQRPVPDARYRIGSITKTFVAALALQLVGEGRLALDRSIREQFPGLPAEWQPITLRHLIQHEHGLQARRPTEFDDPALFLSRRFDHHSPWEMVRYAAAQPLEFTPGTKWNYSGVGYKLLSLIISHAAGRHWTTELHHRILRPLGLHATRAPSDNPFLPEPNVHGYLRHEGRLVDVTHFNPTMFDAYGGMSSTNRDLDVFLTALFGGRLLKPAQQAELTKLTSVSGNWGVGVIAATLPCGIQAWGHGGGVYGYFSTAMSTLDGSRRVTAVVSGIGLKTDEEAYYKAVVAAMCG